MQQTKNIIDEFFGESDESKKFGKLTVISFHRINKDGNREWWCECECGAHTVAKTNALKSGHKKSCGCLKRDPLIHTTHGESKTRLYREWLEMKKRGKSKKGDYKNIFLYDEWKNDFIKFKDWALENGYNDSLTLDRIDTTKNYRPSNCRWTSSKVQNNNRIDTIYIPCGDEDIPLSYISTYTKIPYLTLYSRLKKNPDISYDELISEQVYNKDRAKIWRMYKLKNLDEFMDFLGLPNAVNYLKNHGYPKAEASNISKGAKQKKIRYGHLWEIIEK